MQLNQYIDHTLLKPEAKSADIKRLCLEAREFNFKAVCVNPIFVPLATRQLSESNVAVCTVVGFPLGANSTPIKIAETRLALEHGAHEVDMVINIGALKEKQNQFVESEIRSLAEACHQHGALLKVIFETCLLTDEEITRATILSQKAGADFVKTSTGFSKSGASLHAVGLMKNAITNDMQIKASGGIRDRETAIAYIKAGVHRIGTSSGIIICS